MDNTHSFETEDGVKIAYYRWTPEEAPRLVLQIAHGLGEYALRYADFAKFLGKHGIAVYANDHRGHGKTAGSLEKLGIFSETDGWFKVMDDMHSLSNIIARDYPDTPIFLLGHSMGSFLARTYITLYDNVQGLILSGTAAHSRLLIKISRLLAFFHVRKIGVNTPSHFFNKLSILPFNKKFESEGEVSWLSRDKAVVKAYNEDPYCGFVNSAGFFRDLFEGLDYINNKDNNRWIRFSLPIFVIAGSDDPVGDFGKGPKKVADMYRKLQIEDVQLKLYPGARHEIINEINRDEVYADILEWINKHMQE